MAFKRSDLSVLGYTNGFTQWHYRTTDAALDDQYFVPVADMFHKGDLLIVNLDAESTCTAALYRIEECSPTAVKVTALETPKIILGS